MGRADKRVLGHMRDNDGVLTRRTALAMGMASTTLQEWVEVGHLVVVGRGLYVQPGVLLSETASLRAATTALDAVASHESAARIHGLDGMDPSRITVSVPVRRSNRFPGVVVHQLTDLTPDHITTVSGMAVTKPTRTILDLAAVLPEKHLAGCLDQAVRFGLITYDDAAEFLETLARKGKPGVVKLRRILAARLGGHFVTDSTLESRLLGVIADAGLPIPTTQFRPAWLRKVNGRVDLAYVEQTILIEGDSRRWHMTPEAFQLDRARDNLAQLAGWISLRFTWKDITERPAIIVAQIEQALSMRARAGYPALVH